MNVGEYAELNLLQTLERGLSKAYTLFHSVDWSRGAGAQEQHGEIDIVVVNQGGGNHFFFNHATLIDARGFASIGDFLKIFVQQNVPRSLGKWGFRSSTIYAQTSIL